MIQSRLRLQTVSTIMASEWVVSELQQLSASGNTRKDSVEKYKKIFQSVIGTNKNIVNDLKLFIETGRPHVLHILCFCK